MKAKPRVVVLGAGFGGLELCTLLSEALGDEVDATLIDQNDAFVFGYSKLDFMFALTTPEAVRLPYSHYVKPGVTFVQQTVTAIDPQARRVTTDAGVFEADFLVVALGADYDFAATPGLAEANEFYTLAGATRLRQALPGFTAGRALIAVCGAPYKCPPAPSECALMLHDYLLEAGVRDACEIALVTPLSSPVPPSPETSRALIAAFAERGVAFTANRLVTGLDTARGLASFDDGSQAPYDLFFGVPRHRVPDVVAESGLSQDGWIPVDPRTLQTRWPGVYAVGDGANTGTPKAGLFAEGEARAVASALIALIRGEGEASPYDGRGVCYLEFGGGRIGKVEVDFFSGPTPTGTYHAPTTALRADKNHFGASRRARWFGLP